LILKKLNKMSKKVKELMNSKTEYIMSDSTIGLAALNMKKYNIGIMPVIHHVKGLLCGVITDRDIVIRGIAAGKDEKSLVTEIMTTKLIFVNQNDDLEKALQLMKEHMVRRILVVDDDKKFVGLVTLRDLAVGLKGDEKLVHRVIELLKAIYEQRGAA